MTLCDINLTPGGGLQLCDSKGVGDASREVVSTRLARETESLKCKVEGERGTHRSGKVEGRGS